MGSKTRAGFGAEEKGFRWGIFILLMVLYALFLNPRCWPKEQESGVRSQESGPAIHYLPFTVFRHQANPYAESKLKLLALADPAPGPAPAGQAAGPEHADQVLLSVYDALNGALKANATLSGGSTNPTPHNADQVFLAVYDPVNGAIRVNIVAGGGGGATFQVNGTALTSSGTINFQNSAATNGLTLTFSNPSAGNIQLGLSGTLNDAGLTSGYSGVGACSANTWASALTRNAAPTCTQPSFSSIGGTVGASQLPAPTASTLGGIESLVQTPHQWINSISTSGVPAASQPAFGDISGTAGASQLPAPTASTLGGIESLAATSHQWINTISTSGVPSASQPALSDLTATVTAPIVKSTNNLSCPTCVTGPNITTVGGIIGGYAPAPAPGRYASWFANAQYSNTPMVAPFTFWINNWTACTGTANGDVVLQFGLGLFINGVSPAADQNIWTIPVGVASNTCYGESYLAPRVVPQATPIAIMAGATASTATGIGPVAAQIVGSTSQLLGVNLNAATVAQGTPTTTVYTGFSMSSTPGATENVFEVPIPYPSGATARNLCVYMSTANGAGGTLTITLRQGVGAAGAMADTTLVASVQASNVANTEFCDVTHSVSLAQADRIALAITNNNAAAASGGIDGISMELVPSGTATGLIIFGSNGVTLPGTSATYGVPFTNFQYATENLIRTGMPRAVVGKNLMCYVTTAPVTNSYTLTMYKNGSAPGSGLTISIPTNVTAPGEVSDVSDSISYSALDSFSLQYAGTAGGTAPAISSCAMEVD